MLARAAVSLSSSRVLLGASRVRLGASRSSLEELGREIEHLEAQIEQNEADIVVARNLTAEAAETANETEAVSLFSEPYIFLTSEKRTTSLQRTKWLIPRCPLFRSPTGLLNSGSFVSYRLDERQLRDSEFWRRP